MRLNNLKFLAERRVALRKRLTPVEAILWNQLKQSQIAGRKFRRQHSLGHFIMDFYCPELRLAIELDGAGHFTLAGRIYDKMRDSFLADHGVRVLRFENKLIFEDLAGVLSEIKKHCLP